ncbi:MAG TPA: queuosine precursor transporter [Candidatus Limnocylindrales bacterium]|nr:queuosine precursor transporter [Candidatus Limnocylindrales bacterium]
MSDEDPGGEDARRHARSDPGSPGARATYAVRDASLYPVLVGTFVGLLVISNVAAVKLIAVGPLITDGGAFLFPLVYIVGDVMSEVYGWRAARTAIFTGFSMSVLAAVTFFVVQLAPSAASWENQEAFEAILGFVPRIVLASMLGFLVGQLLNAYVLVRLKERTNERHLWVRLIGSTVVGEFADTLVFCTVAFYGVITGAEFWNYVIVGYGYKTLLEIVLLPVTYRVIGYIKRREPSYRPMPEPQQA